MRQGLERIYLTPHATDKFRRRSNQNHLTRHEARRNMRYLINKGEEGTRDNQDDVEQPVVRADGWIFVMSFDREAVVTVFYNEAK